MALGMSVAQCQREVSAPELSEWIAYDHIEPFGERRADLRAGIVAAVTANAFRGKDSKPFQASDFMPDFDKKLQQQTPEEMFNRLRIHAETHNASLKRKGI